MLAAVDPILGLVAPGVGDIAGSLLGLYTVGIAVRRRMAPVVIARMLMNLAIDAVLGIVPLIGDIADFAFRANRRNFALLEERVASGGKGTTRDWLLVAGAALVFVLAIVGTAYLAYRVVAALAHAL